LPGRAKLLKDSRAARVLVMITIFPMQSNYLPWSWERVTAIVLFAMPLWLAFHFGFKPLRS